jgi:hypothetical protein
MRFQRLMKIVMMNEALKKQEADMKANCKRQKAELEAMLARLKDCPLPPDEMQRMLQIEQVYEQELSRLKQLKQLLSKKAQEIQLLRRKIDDVPTRTELVQCVAKCTSLRWRDGYFLGTSGVLWSCTSKSQARRMKRRSITPCTTLFRTRKTSSPKRAKSWTGKTLHRLSHSAILVCSCLFQCLRQFSQESRQNSVCGEHGGDFERRYRLFFPSLLCYVACVLTGASRHAQQIRKQSCSIESDMRRAQYSPRQSHAEAA